MRSRAKLQKNFTRKILGTESIQSWIGLGWGRYLLRKIARSGFFEFLTMQDGQIKKKMLLTPLNCLWDQQLLKWGYGIISCSCIICLRNRNESSIYQQDCAWLVMVCSVRECSGENTKKQWWIVGTIPHSLLEHCTMMSSTNVKCTEGPKALCVCTVGSSGRAKRRPF